MLFSGEWYFCDDEVIRPVIRGEILAGDGSWRAAEFLVDTGADRTVFSANTLATLDMESRKTEDGIGGVGGIVESVIVSTVLRLTREDGKSVIFRGEYSACMDQEALDMSVLGRDVLGKFAVIVDQPRGHVWLLGGRHTYTIARE